MSGFEGSGNSHCIFTAATAAAIQPGRVKNIDKKASKNNNQTLIRLNGTSDLDFIFLLKKYANFDISNYNNLHFYDYTKILGKVKKYQDNKNYTLTFSRAEDNEKDIFKAVKYQ